MPSKPRRAAKSNRSAAPRAAVAAVHPAEPGAVISAIRAGFGLSRSVFQRLSGFSERAVANWESGRSAPDAPTMRRLNELARLGAALARLMPTDTIPKWLGEPNAAFAGLKPLEVIERGEIDRVWQMLYEVESGSPN